MLYGDSPEPVVSHSAEENTEPLTSGASSSRFPARSPATDTVPGNLDALEAAVRPRLEPDFLLENANTFILSTSSSDGVACHVSTGTESWASERSFTTPSPSS